MEQPFVQVQNISGVNAIYKQQVSRLSICPAVKLTLLGLLT